MNSGTPWASRFRRPIPASLSHTSRRGTAPSWSASNDHIPATRSSLVREGSILAVRNREYEVTITSTGGVPTCPAPSGIDVGGNHRSHWA